MELEGSADASATAVQPKSQDFASLAALAENKLLQKKPKLEKDHSPCVLGFPPFLIVCLKNYSRF